jgi:hypothetical protein
VSKFDNFCRILFEVAVVFGYLAFSYIVIKVVTFFIKNPNLSYLIIGIIVAPTLFAILRGQKVIKEKGFYEKGF